ncbi:aminotransferase class V-fold PLP-dependent enzyme [Lancefieldella parvula]|uniref:aminotransferase class V-fold PLP-dependent enzyme n=1 Tax=Lancefieldella parvula TaxID=1382 RepID=UPI00288BB6E6|nr:aminotransferase class V-fold PLP-dependent enzyme [Lancefieldella parvula]
MIYLNCAATSYKRPQCVVDAVSRALCSFGSTGRGAASAELDAARAVMVARERIALLLGFSHPERVVFTANATDALNKAILGIVEPGDHVVATDWDHNSVLRPLNRLQKKHNVKVDYVPANLQGCLDWDVLERLVSPGTKLVVVTHASNLTGNVCDLERVVTVAHAAGALVLVDAAQTAGSVPINFDDLGVDILAFTGHKALMGPQGTGGLLIAPHVAIEAVIQGGTGVLSFEEEMPQVYPEHLEAGTLNSHGIAGLSAAVDFVSTQGVCAVHRHDLALVRQFVAEARQVPGIELYGSFPYNISELNGESSQKDHAPIVTLNLDGWTSSELARVLSVEYDISVRAGAHCAPRMHRALGTQDTGSVRFSFGFYTTEDEIHKTTTALNELAKSVM